MRSLDRRVTLLGREIRVHLLDTGDGVNVLIDGGDRAHIGAVAVARPGAETRVVAFPGHREDGICRTWAQKLSDTLGCPAVVSAGIHYDGVGRSEIRVIVDAMERTLKEIAEEYHE